LQFLLERSKPDLAREARHDIGPPITRSALVEQPELVLAVEPEFGVKPLQGRQIHAFLLRQVAEMLGLEIVDESLLRAEAPAHFLELLTQKGRSAGRLAEPDAFVLHAIEPRDLVGYG